MASCAHHFTFDDESTSFDFNLARAKANI